ncbi:MAG: methionine--tRNA ligase, partial [Nanoarchaeota archaeon]|nr:methionine--tRNA ligase [Nanoarchaeota archaeon]
MAKEKRLITSALPYVNSFPHIGNIVGSHLPADIYARYCRLAGYETVFIGGSDEHGTATEIAAEREGITPQQLCDKYFKEHEKVYNWFNISYDNFSRTSKPIHHETTQEFFLKAYKNGYITEGTLILPFCLDCKRQLSDRFIEGICPHCGYDKARGDQCEKCGNTLEPQELKEPRCAICKGKNIQFKATQHLFFAINKLSKQLETWIKNNKELRPHVKNAALGWIKEGLKPRCITRNLKWGVKVPLKGYEDLVFYVWYDAPIGYVSSTLEWDNKKGKQYWTDGKTHIYHFLGKDNIIFHTLFFPGSLLATGGYNLPYNVIGLQYLNYEGGKISKSNNWGTSIFCNVLPTYNIDVDYWRFYLTNLIPETKDTDFSWKEFELRVTGDLIDNLGNFINRTLTFVHNKFEGTIKQPKKLDETFSKKVTDQITKILENYEKIELRQTLAEILRLSSIGNEYFNAQTPWKTNDETVIYQCTALCEALALLIQPFLP